MKRIVFSALTILSIMALSGQTEYVDPFIGTSNYGACNPGAVCPNGMMSISPMNVMTYPENRFVKDSLWWSTPYEARNKIITGFSHVNLSGVGCPELGSLLLMPTTGEADVDIFSYGSGCENQTARPGYYSTDLTRYGIKVELAAARRSSVARFTFPKGQGNIIMNLGDGLTNETGGSIRKVSESEFEGHKLLGTFCYNNPDAVFPIYFVMRVNKVPKNNAVWKFQRCRTGYKNEWETSCDYKLYEHYNRELSGDNVGSLWSFDCTEGEQIEVKVGVSFTSLDNARLNLDTEIGQSSFDQVEEYAHQEWQRVLGSIVVDEGTQSDLTVFYTALYHIFIHPNILSDVNGDYPAMSSGKTMKSDFTRYTVFSLWDTYRTVHPFLTLFQPRLQTDMIRSMIEMSREGGWLPKWELYSQESYTMEGDPSIPVIADSWMKGLRDYDIEQAYKTMIKSATSPSSINKMRPDNDDYLTLGYVPLREKYDNSVSHALEYYMADWSLAQLANSMGYTADAERFAAQAMNYKRYYSPQYGTLRPLLPDGTFNEPFDPRQGENFAPCPGFHEGSAWNYTMAIPFDVEGLIKLNGGQKRFVEKLQSIFDLRYFDPTNEPDIIYPYLFNYCKGEQWRTQEEVKSILNHSFNTSTAGLPGNDDGGTLSAWAVFSMLGFYPLCPADPQYTLTTPRFSKVVLHLDPDYSKGDLTIRTEGKGDYIDRITVDGKKLKGYFISHKQLTNSKEIVFYLNDEH